MGGTDAPMLVDHVLNVVFDQVDQSAKVMHPAIPVRDAAAVLLDTRSARRLPIGGAGSFTPILKQMLARRRAARTRCSTPAGARIVHGLNVADCDSSFGDQPGHVRPADRGRGPPAAPLHRKGLGAWGDARPQPQRRDHDRKSGILGSVRRQRGRAHECGARGRRRRTRRLRPC